MERREVTRLDPDEWIDAYGDALFGFALARVRDREAAEDLVRRPIRGPCGRRAISAASPRRRRGCSAY